MQMHMIHWAPWCPGRQPVLRDPAITYDLGKWRSEGATSYNTESEELNFQVYKK
jgi:hypothetical protein